MDDTLSIAQNGNGMGIHKCDDLLSHKVPRGRWDMPAVNLYLCRLESEEFNCINVKFIVVLHINSSLILYQFTGSDLSPNVLLFGLKSMLRKESCALKHPSLTIYGTNDISISKRVHFCDRTISLSRLPLL